MQRILASLVIGIVAGIVILAMFPSANLLTFMVAVLVITTIVFIISLAL